VIIQYRPIGFIRSPFREPVGVPIQPSRAREVRATIIVEPEYVPALADLDGFSHVVLLCHLHRSRPWRPMVVPYLDTVERGLFATRAPSRPNPIGLSVVRLLEVVGDRIEVENVDLIDGTPVLDIKPYVPEFDSPVEVRLGWLEEARRRAAQSDDRFADGGGSATDSESRDR
jgi:tRNA-Thr(GGU) m(6)t(6)A37 methyltransferase TsaA